MNHPRTPDWPAAIAAVGNAFPPARWPQRLRAWLADECAGAQAQEPWCVALSGGADSVAVLLALAAQRGQLRQKDESRIQKGGDAVCGRGAALQPASADGAEPNQPVLKQRATVSPETRNSKLETRRAAPLVALHFNHRLRGAAADGDEAFCRGLCAALEVELVVGAAGWPPGSDVSEAEAREARFSFFGDTMAARGSRALWLGHHRDDVVETMLLRLSRGSGSRGLAAPRPVQRLADGTVRLRPLLDLPKAEIVAALRAAGVPWCEDETNHGDAYFRNRLRRQVVPAWAAAAPADLAEAVARSRVLLEEDDDALERWVDRVVPAPLGEVLPLAPLREAPVAVTRRALHRWLVALDLGDGLGRAAFEELLSVVRAGSELKLSVGTAGFLVVGGGALRLEILETQDPVWSGGALAVPGELALPVGAKLRAVAVSLDVALRRQICGGEFDDGRTAFLAARGTSAGLSIRPWRSGDRYVPLGFGQSSKLQDQFVNRRIPRQLRQRLPVVCAGDGTILWVPGLPPADCVRITDGTMMAVQLTYLPVDSLSAPLHV